MTPRGPLDSSESLMFQVTLPEDPHLTDPALSRNSPAGKGQDTGLRVMWPGLESLLSTHQRCDRGLTACLLQAPMCSSESRDINTTQVTGHIFCVTEAFPCSPKLHLALWDGNHPRRPTQVPTSLARACGDKVFLGDSASRVLASLYSAGRQPWASGLCRFLLPFAVCPPATRV